MFPLTFLREKSESSNLGNGPKSQSWKSSCLKAAGNGDLRVWLMEDWKQWPFHPSFIHCQEILHWWFKSALHSTYLNCLVDVDSSRYQRKYWRERLGKPEFNLAKYLCLNQFTAYSLLRCWEDSFLSARDSSEVGADSLSHFSVTQN